MDGDGGNVKMVDYTLSPLGGYSNDQDKSILNSSSDVSHFNGTVDVSLMQNEVKLLKTRLKQTVDELTSEQDMVSSLRRRVNSMEKDRLDSMSKAHEDTSRLDGELARMRAQLERSEAARQSLEVDASRARRETATERRAVEEKDTRLRGINDNFTAKIEELEERLEKRNTEFEVFKTKARSENEKLKEKLIEKDRRLKSIEFDCGKLESDREKTKDMARQFHASMAEMEEKVSLLKDERRAGAEEIAKLSAENEIIKEREARTRNDLESALDRVRHLEHSIEAERAAHLESKFNSELVQLRTKDLENALDVEKASRSDVVDQGHQLTQQVHQLKAQLRESNDAKSQLESDRLFPLYQALTCAQKDYEILSGQWTKELKQKNDVITQMKGQLDMHQRDFRDLKDQLIQEGVAQKQQKSVEETYSSAFKELEIIINSFNATKKTKKIPKLKQTSIQPAVLVHEAKALLMDYKDKKDNCEQQKGEIKVELDKVKRELQSIKDNGKAKAKELEQTQTTANKTSRELRRVNQESSELGEACLKLSKELEVAAKEVREQKEVNEQLNEQLMKLATRITEDEKHRIEYMHGLYQHLVTGAKVVNKPQESALKGFSWNDLTVLINEQVGLVVSTVTKTTDRIKQLETTIKMKEDAFGQIQTVHEEQLSKMAALVEDRSSSWKSQKQDMEKHYSKLLEEIHSRHKQTQDMADQAWEKVRESDCASSEARAELLSLREQLHFCQQQHDALLTGCALLCGALVPMATKCANLTQQVRQFNALFRVHSSAKVQVEMVAQAMTIDSLNSTESIMHQPLPSLLRFRFFAPLMRERLMSDRFYRRAVIVVIAAKRLVLLRQESQRLFVLFDVFPRLAKIDVNAGSITEYKQDDPTANAITWLTSTDLLTVLLSSVGELQKILFDITAGAVTDTTGLVSCAKTSCKKLLSSVQSIFASPIQLHDPKPLTRLLGDGLVAILSSKNYRESPYTSWQTTVTGIQQEVIKFTHRLHDSEVKRRDLQSDLAQMREQVRALQSAQEQLGAQIDDSVPRDRFDHVCSELELALQREARAQDLLHEQGSQLKTLSKQLNAVNTDQAEVEKTMGQAAEGISKAQKDLKRQEQKARDLHKQVTRLEDEKRHLKNKVHDAENALRTTAKDREDLNAFLTSTHNALKQIKVTGQLVKNGQLDISPLVSQAMTKRSLTTKLELNECQNLLVAFVEVVQLLNTRLTLVMEEVTSHQRHVTVLKDELNAACLRGQQVEHPTSGIGMNMDLELLPVQLPAAPQRTMEKFIPLTTDETESSVAPDTERDKLKIRESSFLTPAKRKQKIKK